MDRILVFPCGSEIGLEIARAFEGIKHIELIGGSSVDDHGRFIYKKYIDNIPPVLAEDFHQKILEIVETYQVDYLFPAHDAAVLKFAQMQNDLPCKVIGSPLPTAMLSRSKKKTYQFFRSALSVPTMYNEADLDDDILFPVFLKPDVGQGSKGVYKAHNKAETLFYLNKDPSLLILEYLPGEEYTVDCYTDSNGRLQFSGGRKRHRILNGISVNTMPVYDPAIQDMANIINDLLIFKGAWFFQLKRNRNDTLTLLEIAPRVAGSMALFRIQGVNLPLLSYYCHKGIPGVILQNRVHLEMDRALTNRYLIQISYQHVYIDFDDCIFMNGRINEQAIQFLFRCINDEKKIYLVTRHRGDIYKKLDALRISQLFDEVYHLREDKEKKSDYIRHQDAIFIDDSFRERKDVMTRLGLPVFGVDNLEGLVHSYPTQTVEKLKPIKTK